MATAVASFSSDGWNQDANPVVTKPTGLADGDLMIAVVGSCIGDVTSVTEPSTPSGWTKIVSQVIDTSNGWATVFAKVADSADASASDFTFPCDTSNSHNVAGLYRITGDSFAIGSVVASDSGTDGAGTSVSASISMGTVASNALIIMGWVGIGSTAGQSFSAYTVSGTNPSWTERLDTDAPGDNEPSIAIADASIATPRTLTSFGVTADELQGNYGGVIISVAEQQSATGTFTHLAVSPTLVKPSGVAGTVGTHAHLTVSPTINKPTGEAQVNTEWTNEDQVSTTWINESNDV